MPTILYACMCARRNWQMGVVGGGKGRFGRYSRFCRCSRGVSGKTHGVFPETHGVFSETHGVFSKTHGVFSKTHGVFSKTHGVFSKTHGVFGGYRPLFYLLLLLNLPHLPYPPTADWTFGGGAMRRLCATAPSDSVRLPNLMECGVIAFELFAKFGRNV